MSDALVSITNVIANHRVDDTSRKVLAASNFVAKETLAALDLINQSSGKVSCDVLATVLSCAKALTPPPFSIVVSALGAICSAAMKVQAHRVESCRLATRLSALQPLLVTCMQRELEGSKALCERMLRVVEDCQALINKFIPSANATSEKPWRRFSLWAKSVFTSVTTDIGVFEAQHKEVDRILLEYNFAALVNMPACPTSSQIAEDAQLSLKTMMAEVTSVLQESMNAESAEVKKEIADAQQSLEALLTSQLSQLHAKVDELLVGVQKVDRQLASLIQVVVKEKKMGNLMIAEERLELGSELLGSGGNARVISAKYLGQDVAAKTPSGTGMTKQQCQLLMDEAQLQRDLNSPSIVKCFGICVKGGVTYILLDRCHCSLRQVMKERPSGLDWRLATHLALSLAAGLLTLHDREIVHRDVKVDNAMLIGAVAKLADLGSARRQQSLASVGLSSTATTGMRGLVGMTHCYAPPEIHFDPENARATKKADVFSLGLLVFELCTGKVPYPAQRSNVGSTTIPPPLQQWLRAAWAPTTGQRCRPRSKCCNSWRSRPRPTTIKS